MRAARLIALVLVACGGNPSAPAVELPRPRAAVAAPASDDPEPSTHTLALDKLIGSETTMRSGNGINIPLPDADGWDDVNFILVPSVVSIQYGKEDDFRAILGGFLVRVPNASTPGACARDFEVWAAEWLDAFDVDYKKGRTWAGPWTRPLWPGERTDKPIPPGVMEGGDVLGKVATLIARGTYHCAYMAYPAWKDTCLVIGVGIPSRGEDARARALRDRFAREVLPNVTVSASTPPTEVRH